MPTLVFSTLVFRDTLWEIESHAKNETNTNKPKNLNPGSYIVYWILFLEIKKKGTVFKSLRSPKINKSIFTWINPELSKLKYGLLKEYVTPSKIPWMYMKTTPQKTGKYLVPSQWLFPEFTTGDFIELLEQNNKVSQVKQGKNLDKPLLNFCKFLFPCLKQEFLYFFFYWFHCFYFVVFCFIFSELIIGYLGFNYPLICPDILFYFFVFLNNYISYFRCLTIMENHTYHYYAQKSFCICIAHIPIFVHEDILT